ncbi:Nn.00g012700.m01.CDS01 [Neocucurbitaria sp. VM-36]
MAVNATSTSAQTHTSKRLRYPEGVPYKFSSDGVVQQCPGNTTLCHVPLDSPILPGLQSLYTALKNHLRFLGRISLLPPASWHMTVVDGICEKECEPGMWPPGQEKQPLADSTKNLSSSLHQLGLMLEEDDLAPPYRMKFAFFDANAVGIGIRVEGATAEDKARMR